ncbi:MAG: ABC transporter permease [Candidatus Borkfalkiaceae bacterium]|nr:ABC transporter permease [Christensenellaceae bacterium]
MKSLFALIKRNTKLFFLDKGMLFSSLITPMILLVLYATFLKDIFYDSFAQSLPEGFTVSKSLIEGMVGGELVSSILAVSCVTVAFCSNLIMVQDKVNGARKDLLITPVKKSVLSLSYYVATLINTLTVCFTAAAACFVYLAIVGWYLSFTDVLLILLDTVLLSMFGTALSSIVNSFLTTQGQMSAVGTIVSAGYGFICGAYMPIHSFGDGLQKVLSFLPGTYGTSLMRNHALNGTFNELADVITKSGASDTDVTAIMNGIKEGIDCKLSFFGTEVSVPAMAVIVLCSTAVLIGVYVLINALKKKRA